MAAFAGEAVRVALDGLGSPASGARAVDQDPGHAAEIMNNKYQIINNNNKIIINNNN